MSDKYYVLKCRLEKYIMKCTTLLLCLIITITFAITITKNEILIERGETITITESNIKADIDGLTFIVSDLQHGHFEVNGIESTTFTHQNILDSVVTFTTDTSDYSPIYRIQASTSIRSLANIEYYRYSKVNIDEFQISTYTIGVQFGPVVTKLDNGNFAMAWHSGTSGTVVASMGVYVRIMNSDYEFVSGIIFVGTGDYGSGGPCIETFSSGRFIVAWPAKYSGIWDIYATVLNNDGSTNVANFKVNLDIPGNYNFMPSISAISNVHFIVAWAGTTSAYSDYRVFYRGFVFNPTFNAFTGSVRIDQGATPICNDMQYYPKVTTLTGGHIIMVYKCSGILRIQLFDANIVRQGNLITTESTGFDESNGDVIALDNNKFVVSLLAKDTNTDERFIYAKIYYVHNDNIYSYQSKPMFLVSHVPIYEHDDIRPSAMNMNNGRFMIMYAGLNNVYGQIYTYEGVRLSMIQLNYNELGVRKLFNSGSLAYVSAANAFVAVWEDSMKDDDDYGVFGQIFSYEQSPMFIVNDISLNEGSEETSIEINAINTTSYSVNTSLAYGHFEDISSPGVSITQFSDPETIKFIYDQSGNTPEYTITATNGLIETAQLKVSVSTNDKPIITLTSGTLTFVEEGDAKVIDATLTLTEDKPNLVSATLVVTNNVVSNDDDDVFTFVDQNGITGSLTTDTLTLTGTATVAEYQTALRSITWKTTSVNPATSKTITITVNDGDLTSDDATIIVTITPVNNIPYITLTPTSVSYTEQDTITPFATLTILDVDNIQLTNATVIGVDTLGFVDQNGIVGDYTNSILTLTGTASVANYQTAIRSITYSNPSDNPSVTAKHLYVYCYDGELNGNMIDVTINTTPVNDKPTVSVVNKLEIENTNVEFASSDFTDKFVDIDDDTLTKIQITNLPLNGILKFSSINVVANQEINVGDVTSLEFIPNTDWTGSTSFNWKGHDGTEYSDASMVVITINEFNNAPTIANVNKQAVYAENDVTFTLSDFTNAFNDLDGNPLNKIQIVSLPANGNLKLIVTNVTVNQEITNTDLFQLKFTHTPGWYGTTSFTWKGSDGLLWSNVANVVMTVDQANHAPTITSIDKDSINEDNDVIFTLSDFTSVFTDTDSNVLNKIQIMSLPLNGNLKLMGSDVTMNQEVSDTDVFKLTFTPTTNWYGDTSFSWKASDGLLWSNIASIAMTITSVNDVPTISSINKLAVDEDNEVLFSVSEFTNVFTDIESSLTKIKFVALPANGNLLLNGVAVVQDQECNIASVVYLKFIPTTNWYGTTSFSWKGYDGSDWSNSANVVITINEVNDPPIINPDKPTIPSQEIEPGELFTFTFDDDIFVDVDGTLSFTVKQVSGQPLPTWLHFDSTTRTFSGTPPEDFSSGLHIRVTATDANGNSISRDFVIDGRTEEETIVGKIAGIAGGVGSAVLSVVGMWWKSHIDAESRKKGKPFSAAIYSLLKPRSCGNFDSTQGREFMNTIDYIGDLLIERNCDLESIKVITKTAEVLGEAFTQTMYKKYGCIECLCIKFRGPIIAIDDPNDPNKNRAAKNKEGLKRIADIISSQAIDIKVMINNNFARGERGSIELNNIPGETQP